MNFSNEFWINCSDTTIRVARAMIGAKVTYSQLSLRRTPLGPALSVRLIESQIKEVKKGRDQL